MAVRYKSFQKLFTGNRKDLRCHRNRFGVTKLPSTMSNPKFEPFQSRSNQQYYFRLRAANGEPVLHSEGYTSKQNCLNAISSVKRHAPHDNFYKRSDSAGNYTFNLLATNGEIIGQSENYTSYAARENGIDAVKRDAPGAPVIDLT